MDLSLVRAREPPWVLACFPSDIWFDGGTHAASADDAWMISGLSA